MAGPKFRLQSVLDYREQRVDLAKGALGAAVQQVQAQRQTLLALNRQMAALAAEVQAAQRGLINTAHIAQQLAYLQQLRVRECAENQRLADLSRQAEVRRQELAQAMQDKQVLEKLKERHMEQARQAEAQRESRLLDEIGVIRFRQTPDTGEH
jgi:flagellar FliJ protein